MTTVLVTGVFDGLHPGHEDLFRQAHEQGEHLIVLVARDETVKRVKGHWPRIKEMKRLEAIRNHPLVQDARLGGLGDKLATIEDIKPDVIMLGYDQQAFTEDLEAKLATRNLHPRIVRATAFQPERYKSSLLYGAGEKE